MASYVIINILMAFVIDVYTSIEESQKQEDDERKVFIRLGKQVTSKTETSFISTMSTLGDEGMKSMKETTTKARSTLTSFKKK